MSEYGHPDSSAGMEKDFGTAQQVMPPNRNGLDGRYFQAQLIAKACYKHLPTIADMPADAMTINEVDAALPEAGFGVHNIDGGDDASARPPSFLEDLDDYGYAEDVSVAWL